MRIPDWLYFSTLILGSAASFAFFLWALKSILDDYFSIRWQRQFENDVTLAIADSQPSWEQILEIAETRNVGRQTVYRTLQRLIREALTGRNAPLKEHLGVLEGYLAKLKEDEPFEGLPDELRVHLERVREQLPNGLLVLLPLASQIRVLVAINEKVQRRQRYYTVGGFFIGMVGVVFAAVTYFHPYSSAATVSSQNIAPYPHTTDSAVDAGNKPKGNKVDVAN